MKIPDVLTKLKDMARLRHLSLATERAYLMWLRSYIEAVRTYPADWTSEQKVEQFLTNEARRGVAASTQNQALNALMFFYGTVLGTPLRDIDALRVRRPAHVRVAISASETRALLSEVQDTGGYATRLVVWMLYGCGLRVTEPLELRRKDVDLEVRRLVIRGAKGGKDRVVELPDILADAMAAQLRVARAVWQADVAAGLPVALPGLLAKKSPRLALTEAWSWVFPAHKPSKHPRTGQPVRWRMHEVNVQRAVRAAAAKAGISSRVTPHLLRHCYATHAHEAGASVRDLQAALGHSQIETTMRYLTPSRTGVTSPLEAELPGPLAFAGKGAA
jgi:integron integrase